MVRRTAWVMSEEDIFRTLNDIEDRLAQPALTQDQVDVLVRLRALLEADAEVDQASAPIEENHYSRGRQKAEHQHG